LTCIAVFNQKGGVGKTTTALNLGGALALKKKPTIYIDLDPQGHLSQVFAVDSQSRIANIFEFYKDHQPLASLLQPLANQRYLIPSHKELTKVDSMYGKGPTILNKLKTGIASLRETHPNTPIVIDCCPYIGVLSLNAIFAADLLIVPIASDYMSLAAAKKVAHALQALEPVLKKKLERRYVLTQYDKRQSMTFEVEKNARAHFGQEVCKTTISTNVALAESPQHQKDIFQYSPSSTGASDYAALVKELSNKKLV
jgi:chromosome partitioning protein